MHPSDFGPYRAVRLLGRGGMGAVFEATDPTTGETVAIKTLPHHLADDEVVRRRFKSEIDTLMNLRHPGIARMLAFGDQDGLPFFAMEFVAGRSLEELLRSGRRFSWRETAAVTVEILRALKSAHDHGVVHRDLKPANLMFPPAAGGGFHVKLTDFGIAKLFGETGHTRSGNVVGTPEYMSPEQAADLPVDHRADIYCLGLVMVAMMTGSPPFRGPLRDVLECQRTRRPPRIATLVPDVPPALDDLIDRMLDKQAAHRPANAAVVSHTLTEILASKAPTPPRRASPDQAAPTVAMPDAAERLRKSTPPGDAVPLGPRDTTVAIDLTASSADHSSIHSDSRQGQPPAGRSTFTTIEDLDRQAREREARRHRLRIVGGSLVALATVAGVCFAMWSFLSPVIWPSADSQYERIVTISSNPAHLEDPCPLIKAFLQAHSDDPRADGVRRMGREIALERLRKRSRRKLPGYRPKSDAERLYLEAIRAEPTTAVETLRSVIRIAATPAAGADTADDPCAAVERPDNAMWCELARRELELIEPLVRQKDAAQREAKEIDQDRAEAILKRAAALKTEADTTPDAARRVIAITFRHQLLEELVEAYADKPHAAAAVAEARQLLAAGQ